MLPEIQVVSLQIEQAELLLAETKQRLIRLRQPLLEDPQAHERWINKHSQRLICVKTTDVAVLRRLVQTSVHLLVLDLSGTSGLDLPSMTALKRLQELDLQVSSIIYKHVF